MPRIHPISVVLFALVAPFPRASDLLADEVDDAVALLNTGQYAECIRVAEEGVEGQTWRESWWHLKLRAELATGRYQDALETLDTALKRFPSSIRMRLVGHEVYRFNDRPEEAAAMLDEIEAMVSRQSWRYADTVSRVALGQFFLLRGADARQVLETFFDRAKRDRPSYVEAYLATGELALAKHDDALAAEAYRLAAKFAPDDPAVHFGLAQSLVEGDPEGAAKALARALEINPNHADSLLMQADRLIDSERYDEAEELLTRVLDVNPRHPKAHAYRAVLAHLQGDETAERERRDAALDTWSTNPEVDHLIGRKLSQKYRFAEGAAYQRQALEFDPSYLPARMQLSQDLLRLGDEEQGWRLAGEVYEQDGYNVAAHNLVVLEENLSKFRTLEADGFLLRMNAREAEVYGNRALELLRRAKDVLCAKYEVDLPEPIIVEIFPEKQDFAVRTFGMPFVEGFLGVCFGTVITANSPASQRENPANWEAVLWHEFCHTVTLHKSKNRMPRWLSEGISVYEEKQENPAWGQSMNAGYRKLILDGGLTPVSRLSGAFLDPPSPMHLQFAYFESSLVVEYLVETQGVETLRDILTALACGTSMSEVLERHTGPLDELDAAFAEFAEKRARQFAPEADFTSPELPPDAEFEAVAEWSREHPNNVAGLKLLAGLLLEQRKWQQAKEPLNRLLDVYPKDTEPDNAYVLLAKVHRELGETAEERAVLEKLAAVDGDAVDVYRRLVELCGITEDWEGVADHAERMLAVDPMLRGPHRELARAAEALEDRPRAISAYRALLEMEPVDPVESHYRLAKLLHQAGDVPRARRHVLEALEEAPRYRAAQALLLEIVDGTAKLSEEAGPVETAQEEAR